MLEKISYSDRPLSRNKSKNTLFAETCVDEFARLTCDAAKVSGWPIPREASSLISTMRTVIKAKGLAHKMRAHSDKEFVYLSRIR